MEYLRDIVQDIISNMMRNNGRVCDVLLTISSYNFIDADANINDINELLSNQLDHCKIDVHTRSSIQKLIVDHVQNERASKFCQSFSNMNHALSTLWQKDVSVKSELKISSLLYIGE